jgi:hypothetical protein
MSPIVKFGRSLLAAAQNYLRQAFAPRSQVSSISRH